MFLLTQVILFMVSTAMYFSAWRLTEIQVVLDLFFALNDIYTKLKCFFVNENLLGSKTFRQKFGTILMGEDIYGCK